MTVTPLVYFWYSYPHQRYGSKAKDGKNVPVPATRCRRQHQRETRIPPASLPCSTHQRSKILTTDYLTTRGPHPRTANDSVFGARNLLLIPWCLDYTSYHIVAHHFIPHTDPFDGMRGIGSSTVGVLSIQIHKPKIQMEDAKRKSYLPLDTTTAPARDSNYTRKLTMTYISAIKGLRHRSNSRHENPTLEQQMSTYLMRGTYWCSTGISYHIVPHRWMMHTHIRWWGGKWQFVFGILSIQIS